MIELARNLGDSIHSNFSIISKKIFFALKTIKKGLNYLPSITAKKAAKPFLYLLLSNSLALLYRDRYPRMCASPGITIDEKSET